jgi:hypothetical protein
MSHHTSSSLALLQKPWLTNVYGPEVSLLLTGEQIERRPEQLRKYSTYHRRLSIISRGGWFQTKFQRLQRISGISGAAYLGEGPFQFERRQVTTDDKGRVVWVETHAYTVLRSGWDEEISSISRLENWCRENPEEAAHVLEVSAKWLLPALESRFFTLEPSNEGLGEGEGPEFFFCVLHTIGDIMRLAKFHEKLPNLMVVYETVLPGAG